MGYIAYGPFVAGNVVDLVRPGASKVWLPQFGYPVQSSFGAGEVPPRPEIDATVYIGGANNPVAFPISVPTSDVATVLGASSNTLGASQPITSAIVTNSAFGVCVSYHYTDGFGSAKYTDWLRFLQFPVVVPADLTFTGITLELNIWAPGGPYVEVEFPPKLTLYTFVSSFRSNGPRHRSLRR